jgi:hypothetical protein
LPSDSATPGAARSSDRVDPVSDAIPIEFPALSESSGVGWEQATKGGPEMIGKRSTIAMTGSTLLLLAGGGAAYAASQQSSQHALTPGVGALVATAQTTTTPAAAPGASGAPGRNCPGMSSSSASSGA